MYEEYLKDPQGYTLLDAYGNPVPVELQNSVLGYETDRPPTTGRTHPLAQHAKEGQSPSRRIPLARRPRIPLARRPIGGGNPNGIWAWWTALKAEHRLGIVGGIGLLGVIVAASQKGKGSSLEKV